MRRSKASVGAVMVGLGLLLISLVGFAQGEGAAEGNVLLEPVTVVEEMIGHIDWEEGYIYAVGDGVPPTDAVSPAQARVRAKRAAIDTAYARLLEMAEAVRVDAESTTLDYINVSYAVHTRVSGLVQNAEIVELRQFEDGSFQVLMRMPIKGMQGLASAVLPMQIEKVIRVGIAYRITAEEMKEARPEQVYTGLIVDARGLGAKPAMYPRLITVTGEAIYDVMSANPNLVIEKGLVEYCTDLEKAEGSPRIGDNPLVVEAINVSGECSTDIVLTDGDAKTVAKAVAASDFLSSARVIIILD